MGVLVASGVVEGSHRPGFVERVAVAVVRVDSVQMEFVVVVVVVVISAGLCLKGRSGRSVGVRSMEVVIEVVTVAGEGVVSIVIVSGEGVAVGWVISVVVSKIVVVGCCALVDPPTLIIEID